MDGMILGEANRILSKHEYALYYSSVQPNLEEITQKDLEEKLERIEMHLSKLKSSGANSKRLKFLQDAKMNMKHLLEMLRKSSN